MLLWFFAPLIAQIEKEIMGLFSRLFGSGTPTKVELLPDRIWLTEEAKWNGIASEVVERADSGSVAVLLVAQFPTVLTKLQEIAEQQAGDIPVMVVMASDLSVDLGRQLTLVESPVIDIIVGERHPLRAHDQQLEQLADALPCRTRLAYHLSLEDPLMKTFAGEWVHQILEQLGMKEDETIESPLVSRQIAKAQQRIEQNLCSELEANSSAEWLEKNFRSADSK